jgi:hypothetical protein
MIIKTLLLSLLSLALLLNVMNPINPLLTSTGSLNHALFALKQGIDEKQLDSHYFPEIIEKPSDNVNIET